MMYATVKKTWVSFSDDPTVCMKATTARSNIRSFTTSEEISGSSISRDGEILTLAAGNMVILLAWTLNLSRYLLADANCTVWVNAETKLWCSRFPGAPVLEWWPLVSVPDHLPPRDQCLQREMPSSPKSRWLFIWFTHLLLRVFAWTFIKSHHIYPQAPKSTSLPVPAFSPSLFHSNAPLSSCSVSS